MPAYIRYNNTPKELQDEWINNNLSPQDQSSFLAAFQQNDLLWKSYLDQGLIISEPIYETVNVPELNDTITTQIGEKLILAAGVNPSQLQMHPDYAHWLSVLPEHLFGKVLLQD